MNEDGFANQYDWQIPSVNQLTTLYEADKINSKVLGRGMNIHIDSIFSKEGGASLWSIEENGYHNAFGVIFNTGNALTAPKSPGFANLFEQFVIRINHLLEVLMKKVLVVVLIIFLLSGINPFLAQAIFPGENIVFGNRGQSNEQNNEALMKAYDLATQKKHKQALTLIEQNIVNSPKLATLHVMKGLVLNEMGEYLLANRALNKGLSIETRHPGVQYGFCEVYRNLGMSEPSLQACKIAEEMHIRSPEAHYEYAQTLIATGKMELANKSLSTAAQLDPKNTQYHYQRGMNFYYLNRYDAAEKSFLKALSIDSTDVNSSYQLAYLYAARKKVKLANQQIEKVLRIQKEHPKIHSAKLLLEYVKKNALDKLPLKIIPHDYHVGRSKSHYRSGAYGLSLIEIETAERLKPDNLQIKEILIGLTGFLLRISKTEKAINRMISIVGETDTATAKGYQELGDIEVLRGNLSKARTYYEKVLKTFRS